MALIELETDDDTARKVAAFFHSGHRGRLTFVVEGRRVLEVECSQVWRQRTAVRAYFPTATGVYLPESLTRGIETP